MARVNIEECFWGEGRLDRFRERMGWSRREAVGCFALLWHESQEALCTEGTAEEIAEWCGVLDADEARRLIAALVAGKYIHEVELGGGRYEIHGNVVQIDNRVQKIGASSKGGEATKAKWAAIKKAKAEADAKPKAERPGPGQPEEGRGKAERPAENETRPAAAEPSPRPMQGNARQCNADQGKAAQHIRAGAREAPPPEVDFLEIWNANCSPLPRASKLSDARLEKIRLRLAEEPDPGYWQRIVKKLAASEFCRSKKWATFDWLIANDGNHVKVADGNYDDPDAPEPPACAACGDTGLLGMRRGFEIGEAGCPDCGAGERTRVPRWGAKYEDAGWKLDRDGDAPAQSNERTNL